MNFVYLEDQDVQDLEHLLFCLGYPRIPFPCDWLQSVPSRSETHKSCQYLEKREEEVKVLERESCSVGV